MDCGRCGTDKYDEEAYTRLAAFSGPEPTNQEVADLITGPGMVLCPDCLRDYLDFLSENPNAGQ